MIPILYESTEKAFTSNGIGRLSDAISCKVKEERNGIYELEMVYPVTGVHYSELNEDRLILAKPNDTSQNQIFRIYSIEKPFNGKVKVLAEHISYILNAMVVKPFSASSCTEAIAKLPQNFVTGSSDFTFDTDKQVTGNFVVEEPISARAVLGGSSGSLLDVYGKADYEFDNFTVHMWQNRGSDNGVTIRYGKNLTDLTSTTDDQETYAGVVPFWRGTPEDSEEEVLVTLPGYIVWSSHQWDFAYPRIAVYDASSDFDDEPSADALRQRAHSYLTNNESWNKKKELDVDFVSLWQTEEYKDVAAAERVSLCDSVTVTYPKLGVSEKLKVIKTDYNVLLERYNSITLGETRTNLITEVASVDEKFRNFQVTTKTSMQLAIEHATNLITGGAGGHVVIGTDADGKPNEIYIMNTDDTETATQILRMNVNGIGFANNFDGPYYSAWTLDGHFNADFIYGGTINANLIKAGVIESENHPGTYWNLESGEFHLSTGDAQQIAQYVDASGILLAMPYTLNGNVANFTAELRVGDDITTLNHPPGAFQWFKKEDYEISYLGAGYTCQFDLANFVYGGSIILRYDKTFDYGLLLDSDGNYLLEDGGDRLVYADGDQNADYLYAETDFTNGTRTAELEVTANGILSRLNHFNGTNTTFESTFNQTAEQITSSVTAVSNNLENNYYTKTQTTSQISQKADEITSEVSQTYATQASQTSAVNSLSSRITQNATSISTEVTNRTNADSSLSSRINQSAHTISIGVSRNTIDKTNGASITVTLKDANGKDIDSDTSGTIKLDGNVVFTSQLSDGNTTISGSNIKTGTIDASTVTVSNISADNITSGTLTGRTVSGGKIIQTVSGAREDGLPGNKSNGEQASIENGVVKAGELAVKGSITTVSFVPEGGDGRGSYGIYCTGHFSTEGALWTNGELGEADIICRGNAFAQNFIQSSDRDLKQDIEELTEEEACRVVYGLSPVTFSLKEQPKVKNHGFIAQEVQPLVKDNWGIVTETDIRMIGDRKALGINYIELIADLVAVVQSQNERITALEKELEVVNERIGR